MLTLVYLLATTQPGCLLRLGEVRRLPRRFRRVLGVRCFSQLPVEPLLVSAARLCWFIRLKTIGHVIKLILSLRYVMVVISLIVDHMCVLILVHIGDALDFPLKIRCDRVVSEPC